MDPGCKRKSLLSNPSQNDTQVNTIFKDTAITAALVDRLTHHRHLLEMNGDSYRFRQCLKNKGNQ
ncbi:ATP-binding protein [Vampirovibrio sp.]|uniref:ATP-binding protein n=1 Tax=Vampirovibrio sp. TaxID=2717857 RepID=UPI00359385A5